MSLDSVALLLEWENYFGISISQREAGRINTVQNAVTCICKLLNIEDEESGNEELFARLQQAMVSSGLTARQVKGNELVTYYLPGDNEGTWQRLAAELGLEIPMPDLTKPNVNPRIIFFRKRKKPGYDYSRVTFNDLTDIIAAANYQTLANGKKADSTHEVHAAVVGITADKAGTDLYEINRNSSFTNDLGID